MEKVMKVVGGTDKDNTVVDLQTERNKQIWMLRTKMGTFVGRAKYDEEGQIILFEDSVEMVSIMMPQGMGITGILVGTINDFPDNEEGGSGMLLIELDQKSDYFKKYKEITSGLDLSRVVH
jgi:hypothetical protein